MNPISHKLILSNRGDSLHTDGEDLVTQCTPIDWEGAVSAVLHKQHIGTLQHKRDTYAVTHGCGYGTLVYPGKALAAGPL